MNRIRFIFREQELWTSVAIECPITKLIVGGQNGSVFNLAKDRFGHSLFPRPGVAKPERREQMKVSRLRTAVMNGDADQQIFWIRFGIFNENVEIPVRVKYACIEQFIFE